MLIPIFLYALSFCSYRNKMLSVCALLFASVFFLKRVHDISIMVNAVTPEG